MKKYFPTTAEEVNCAGCGKSFIAYHNRARYCPDCRDKTKPKTKPKPKPVTLEAEYKAAFPETPPETQNVLAELSALYLHLWETAKKYDMSTDAVVSALYHIEAAITLTEGKT